MNLDWSTLPVGADPKRDIPWGQDELGNTQYRMPNGSMYVIRPAYRSPEQRTGAPGSRERLASVVKDRIRDAIHGVKSAMSSPSRALDGEVMTNGDMLATAGLTMLGGVSIPTKTMESRAGTLYTRPTKSEVGDALGRTGPGGVDIEGRPLTARYVVGRTPDRAVEQSLPSEALAEIVERFTGGPVERTARLGKGRNDPVGQLGINRFTGQPTAVRISDKLNARQSDDVIRHEVGHLLDEIAGQIDTKGLSAELKPLYHYGIEGVERERKHTLPQHLGYRPDEISREYVAEAIRQYMGAPDTMKAVAPKTAAAIRKGINSNPKLMDMVQFNANAAPELGLMSMSGQPKFDQERQGLIDYLRGGR